MHKFILRKILTGISLLAPAANMLGTNRFPIDCLKWHYAAILESICEINSIIFFSCLTDGTLYSSSDLLSSFLLRQIILRPTPFLPFTLLDKIIPSPIPLFSSDNFVEIPSSLCSSWTKTSKSNSNFTKIFPVQFSF